MKKAPAHSTTCIEGVNVLQAGISALAICLFLAPSAGLADMCPPKNERTPGGPFKFCELGGVFEDEALFSLFSYRVEIGTSPRGQPLAKVTLTTQFTSPGGTATEIFTPFEPKITTALNAEVCSSSDYGGFVNSGGVIEFIIRFPWDGVNDQSPSTYFSTVITSCEAP